MSHTATELLGPWCVRGTPLSPAPPRTADVALPIAEVTDVEEEVERRLLGATDADTRGPELESESPGPLLHPSHPLTWGVDPLIRACTRCAVATEPSPPDVAKSA